MGGWAGGRARHEPRPDLAMGCPEVMYGAYYPYLYGRAAGPRPGPTFASPFSAHQYDRVSHYNNFMIDQIPRLYSINLYGATTEATLKTFVFVAYVVYEKYGETTVYLTAVINQLSVTNRCTYSLVSRDDILF